MAISAARHVLVAAADRHEAIHSLAADDRFNGVGNDFAGNQRVFHPLGAHRDAVGNGDGIEDDRFAACGVGAGFGLARQFVDVHVARRNHAPGRSDADHRLGEILLLEIRPDKASPGWGRVPGRPKQCSNKDASCRSSGSLLIFVLRTKSCSSNRRE